LTKSFPASVSFVKIASVDVTYLLKDALYMYLSGRCHLHAIIQTDGEFRDNRGTASHASNTVCTERIAIRPSHMNCPTGVKFGIQNQHVMLPKSATEGYKRPHSSSGRQLHYLYAYTRVYRDILEVKNASVYITEYSTCSHIADSAAPQQARRRLAQPLV
jgi:hypothetical protein